MTETAVRETKKFSILEGIFFNGMYLSTQGFIMLNLALYFNANPFFIAIISILPTATQVLQIFTKKLYLCTLFTSSQLIYEKAIYRNIRMPNECGR